MTQVVAVEPEARLRGFAEEAAREVAAPVEVIGGRADSPGMRRVQRLVDATLWPVLRGGCHTGNDTQAAIVRAGLRIREVEKFAFPVTRIPSPASTHILGVAESPGGADGMA
ncbi:hypothetical protein [Streptomyces sp. V3I7]|uniref:hypothetical protein n=1 Tax=Streptomyces sp. V3I7 TaxID=3042278 RepID=UPI00278908AF|nr:hypothetical protein [Streptomyces sp. V3I7]MDQ0989313.1 hypothetical protein [Streptomyces sp. V3I7]